MKQQLKIIARCLLLLILFLSVGGGSLFANGTYELREEQPLSSEKFAAANPLSFAVKDPFHETPDLSKNLFFEISSVVPETYKRFKSSSSASSVFSFCRDLRQNLKIQLFPKHFFL